MSELLLLILFTVHSFLGYVCGNHEESHYAANADKLEELSDEHGCENWHSAREKSIAGKILNSENEPVANASLTISDATGNILGTSSTDIDGQYNLVDIPSNGNFELNISVTGYGTIEKMINTANLSLSGNDFSIE